MKIDVLTLFPEMFEGFLNSSIIKKAKDQKKVNINLVNFRDYAKDKHKKVDDYQFGGGEGMVLMIEPIYEALKKIRKNNSLVILMTPQGEVYHQSKAYQLVNEKHLIIICGHYEGFDERIRSLVDLEISVGDFILTGGEIPALILVDSIIRLIDGVIDESSHQNESFNGNLLDYPVYTKPVDFMGMKVPEVLLSGHHQKISEWRKNEQIQRTKMRRPDLWGDENEK